MESSGERLPTHLRKAPLAGDADDSGASLCCASSLVKDLGFDPVSWLFHGEKPRDSSLVDEFSQRTPSNELDVCSSR
ncbi:hypothetical protein DIPPA_27215 [Diplonema papillatum]|nr:hypothetical protein DIPPA_27215 [Diplonema papillatum]